MRFFFECELEQIYNFDCVFRESSDFVGSVNRVRVPTFMLTYRMLMSICDFCFLFRVQCVVLYLSWLLKLETDFVSFSMFPPSLSNNDLSSEACCAFSLSSLLPGLCCDWVCGMGCCWGAACMGFCGKGSFLV